MFGEEETMYLGKKIESKANKILLKELVTMQKADKIKFMEKEMEFSEEETSLKVRKMELKVLKMMSMESKMRFGESVTMSMVSGIVLMERKMK